jgi:ribosomal protein S18 acetylase RimI-like enzyme
MVLDSPGWHIRAAETRDAEGLVALTTEVAAEDRYIVPDRGFFTADQQRAVLERRDPHFHQVFVAVLGLDAAVAGELEVVRGMWPKNRHTAMLAMVVGRGFRRQGIGLGLLEQVEVWAAAEDVTKLCLSVFESNVDAVRLYERAGYQHEARRPRQFVIGGHDVAELLMAKFLPQ